MIVLKHDDLRWWCSLNFASFWHLSSLSVSLFLPICSSDGFAAKLHSDADRAQKHGMDEFISANPCNFDHASLFESVQRLTLDHRLNDSYSCLVRKTVFQAFGSSWMDKTKVVKPKQDGVNQVSLLKSKIEPQPVRIIDWTRLKRGRMWRRGIGGWWDINNSINSSIKFMIYFSFVKTFMPKLKVLFLKICRLSTLFKLKTKKIH